MLEVHDSTGYGDSNGAVHPDNAVDYWLSSDIRSAIQGQEAYVMINIANEAFGNDASDQWQSFHAGAVQSLRSGGIDHLLVVDAPNWGQDWSNTMRDGDGANAIFNSDPERNVAFSVHMYDVYDSSNAVQSYFSNFLAKGLPLIVGEFAADHGSSGNVDEATIMAQAASRGVGYLGWSWSGNSSDLQSLDITNNFDVNSLTNWGNTLIYGSDGIANTSAACTCFQ
jgi:mannan endo-1,4-beta-mannosidase